MSIVNANIQVSDLYYYITSNQENLNLKNIIGSTLYDAKYRKRIIIDSAVTIGSNSTSTAALIIPSTATGGEIVIDNYGSIQGAGGAVNGGTGGDAILAQALCRINNKSGGTIYGGGGGGGRGGRGGQGGAGSYTTETVFSCGAGGWGGGCPGGCNCTNLVYTCCNPSTGQFDYYCYECVSVITNTYSSVGGTGGDGGFGGRGRGYDGGLAPGFTGAGGSAGGTNAGTGGNGGTGGTGGDWGASGTTGGTGSSGSNGNAGNGLAGSAGSAGGDAGYYINGLSTYVTFTNNGTVAGRTN